MLCVGKDFGIFADDDHNKSVVIVSIVGCFLVSLLAGGGLPVQVALNMEMTHSTGSLLKAVYITFSIGVVLILITLGIQLLVQPGLAAYTVIAFNSSSWWMYIPGCVSVIYILSSIYVASIIGSAAFFVSLVCGQLMGSAVIDEYGFLGVKVDLVSPVEIIGILLVVIAACLMRIPNHWPINKVIACKR